MKINTLLSVCVAAVLVAGFTGCKKEQVDQTKQDIKDGTDKTVDAIKDGASAAKDKAVEIGGDIKDGAVKATDAVKSGTENAVDAVKDKTAEVTGSTPPAPTADTSAADGIIAKAKDLVASAKYQDALTELSSLKGMSLTDAQQKLVDDLKAQIQKGIAGGASSLQNMMK